MGVDVAFVATGTNVFVGVPLAIMFTFSCASQSAIETANPAEAFPAGWEILALMHHAPRVLAPSFWRATYPRLGRLSPSPLSHCAGPRGSPRNVHTVPNLRHDIEEGIGGFLSPKAFRLLAVEYQGGLLSRLNDLVKGNVMSRFYDTQILISFLDTQYENMSILQTIISTSQDPNQTLSFNMASQAMNNSFFLDQLVSNQLFESAECVLTSSLLETAIKTRPITKP